MSVTIIVGKNFGDEGKGLATDYFSALSSQHKKSCLVVRHNGGGQAGHTVDLFDKRFVFHQLSSGSFRGADTYWSQTFLPDLYKLSEELRDFSMCYRELPTIYAHPDCRCVYIDDVLINMGLEVSRGSNRHGSCGMGINEAVKRSDVAEACLSLAEIRGGTVDSLYQKMLWIRSNYLPERLKKLGLHLTQLGEYGELLSDINVLKNAAAQMHCNAQFVQLKDSPVLSEYDDVIFEGAQGLLLDEDYRLFAPHLTTSKTGLHNPMALIRAYLPDTVPLMQIYTLYAVQFCCYQYFLDYCFAFRSCNL